jgi:hypothetical protein
MMIFQDKTILAILFITSTMNITVIRNWKKIECTQATNAEPEGEPECEAPKKRSSSIKSCHGTSSCSGLQNSRQRSLLPPSNNPRASYIDQSMQIHQSRINHNSLSTGPL